MNDRWVKIIQTDGHLRATAITARDCIRDAQIKHGLAAREARALGEVMMAALLLASRRKAKEKISVSVKGDGFLKQSICDGAPEGIVRGFLSTRETHSTPLPQEEKLNQEFGIGPWGEGTLSIVTLIEGQKEPYIGTCELVTGHLAKDLTYYMNQSEQIPSAVGLAVNIGEQSEVTSAGAFLIEVLPGAKPKDIEMVEKNLKQMHGLARALAENSNPIMLLSSIFTEQSFTILEEKPIAFSCSCSKDRVLRAISLLGKDEISDMILQNKGANVKCDFCNTDYRLNESDLEMLISGK